MKRAVDVVELAIPLYIETFKSSPYIASIQETLTAFQNDVVAYDEQVAKIATDPDLSPQGKQNAVAKATQALLKKVADFERVNVNRNRERAKHTEDTLFEKVEIQRPTDLAERLAYEFRLREIRDDLRTVDPLERDAIYASSTDPMIIDAVETAPPVLVKAADGFRRFVPSVDQERVAAVKIARAHAIDPENAKLLEALRAIRQMYKSVIESVRNVVFENSPASRPDPIAAQAAGR